MTQPDALRSGNEEERIWERDIVLAAKVHFSMHEGPGGSGLSRKAILEQIDASLARLGTDYVDLYLAWVLQNPVVTAPIVGATKPHHLADAAASIDIRLSEDEVRALEEPYTPREPAGF